VREEDSTQGGDEEGVKQRKKKGRRDREGGEGETEGQIKTLVKGSDGEGRGVEWRGGGERESEEREPEPLIHLCQAALGSPASKNKSQAWSDGCGSAGAWHCCHLDGRHCISASCTAN